MMLMSICESGILRRYLLSLCMLAVPLNGSFGDQEAVVHVLAEDPAVVWNRDKVPVTKSSVHTQSNGCICTDDENSHVAKVAQKDPLAVKRCSWLQIFDCYVVWHLKFVESLVERTDGCSSHHPLVMRLGHGLCDDMGGSGRAFHQALESGRPIFFWDPNLWGVGFVQKYPWQWKRYENLFCGRNDSTVADFPVDIKTGMYGLNKTDVLRFYSPKINMGVSPQIYGGGMKNYCYQSRKTAAAYNAEFTRWMFSPASVVQATINRTISRVPQDHLLVGMHIRNMHMVSCFIHLRTFLFCL